MFLIDLFERFEKESRFKQSEAYSDAEKLRLQSCCHAIHQYLKEKGINIVFTKHFFEQMTLRRGLPGVYTTEDLMHTFSRIVKSGLSFFNGKPDQTSYAFHDVKTNIIVEIKYNDGKYIVRTTVRDLRWLGTSEKIDI